MIFFTVGTQQRPFDRLVVAADRIAAGDEDVVVQTGTSRKRAQRATFVDFLPFDEFEEQIRLARVVVAHAGIGSVALCLRNGHRPIVVPRLRALGETVDGHQVSFARRMAELDLITLVEDVANLGAAIVAPGAPARRTGLSAALSSELVAFISHHVVSEPDLVRAVGPWSYTRLR